MLLQNPAGDSWYSYYIYVKYLLAISEGRVLIYNNTISVQRTRGVWRHQKLQILLFPWNYFTYLTINLNGPLSYKL